MNVDVDQQAINDPGGIGQMAQAEAQFDPTGMDEQVLDTVLAPRPARLQGLTIGLLDNSKANGALLLSAIRDELGQQYALGEAREYVKDYFGTPAKQELFDQITNECDVVITAIGDCGSCSAATVADGILFERAGLPAVSICSDSFAVTGHAMAEVHGFAEYDFLTVPHPVASLDEQRIRQRAREAMPRLLQILGIEA